MFKMNNMEAGTGQRSNKMPSTPRASSKKKIRNEETT